jgi:ribosome-associated protein
MRSGSWLAAGSARIPLREIHLRFSRSAGPGGQHVNKTESRVELSWDVAGSRALDPAQRSSILARLAGRIDSRGVLHLDCQQTRSQHRNRALALERLAALVSAALRTARPRRPTAPHRSARERRLSSKLERGRTKELRRRPKTED